MPSFSTKSRQKLATCALPLQQLFNEVIKQLDCTVLYGFRSPEEQFELYKRGRELVNGIWVITDKSKVVTYRDGYRMLSAHNYQPSKAVDVAPYPIDWEDIDRFNLFVNHVLRTAAEMGIKIKSGRDFKMKDYPHYELV